MLTSFCLKHIHQLSQQDNNKLFVLSENCLIHLAETVMLYSTSIIRISSPYAKNFNWFQIKYLAGVEMCQLTLPSLLFSQFSKQKRSKIRMFYHLLFVCLFIYLQWVVSVVQVTPFVAMESGDPDMKWILMTSTILNDELFFSL